MATGLAEVLLPCEAAVFDSAVEFFTGKLGCFFVGTVLLMLSIGVYVSKSIL